MTSSTGTVVFNDAKLQAIDVVATERLGVGTLDPASNLHVVGNVHVTGNVNKLNFTDGYTIKRGANVTVFGTTDVIQEITGPHARHVVPLRKYPEVALTAAITSGYTAEASSQLNSAFPSWNAFNGVVETVNNGGGEWISGTDTYDTSATNGAYLAHSSNSVLFEGQRGEYLGIILPSAIKLDYINVYGRFDTTDSRTVREYILWGSNDGSSWTQLQTGTNTLAAVSSNNLFVVPVRATNFYSRFRLQALSMNTNAGEVSIGEMQLYGYEETSDPDTSVDTKITSQFNLPDTTGVKLYVDGDKGSTATDFSGEGHTLTENNATYDSAEKAWEFSSLATSNVTMTSGDLAMEGTHPHSVSLWFNAANVSSNATLFHVGTTAGEGDAKTSISLTETGHLGWIDGGDNQFLSANTWHNLVYATQGGGGVRTCYLDGRKLGDVSVQDTFGEYPPFAMTGYSQGGYTASASSDYTSDSNSLRLAWNCYEVGGEPWMTEFDAFSRSSPYGAVTSGALQGVTITDTNGTSHFGHYNKLETPFKLKVNYLAIEASVDTRRPSSVVILGSNDDENWDLLYSNTNVIDTRYNDLFVNSNRGYKYHMFLVKNLDAGGEGALYINRLQYYGHKENDMTRFPVSSTVLKYPHVAMTGPAQRGYVVSASGTHTNGNHPAFKAFDGSVTSDWQIDGGNYSDSGGGVYTHNAGETTVTNVESRVGDWVQLESPRKIRVKTMKFTPIATYGQERSPATGVLVGSNDGSTWTEIKLFDVTADGTPTSYTAGSSTTLAIDSGSNSSPGYYKIHRLIWLTLYTASQSTYADRADVAELELYGTEEDLDVVARVGEGLDGKVANFRVYDKYLRQEQALELWDSQKDQFGRAESSVSVYRGHVGIGTTTPSAALTVMDEAEEMEELPPRAMTAAETYMEGHGVFKASASSYYGTNTSQYQSYFAFDRQNYSDSWNSITWNSIDASYNSSTKLVSSAATLGGHPGEWLKLSLPYGVKIDGYQLAIRSGWSSYGPDDWVILGSNDDKNWVLVSSVTAGGIAPGSSDDATLTKDFVVETTKHYKYLALVCSKVAGAVNNLNIAELRYFGTRERGQSTLHDGQLTLTKNLTVPRIGPALDADDTPRRDRLVVEYNTSTNPTANGTVKDTSGRALDGFFYGGASYDATEKSLEVPNTTGIIRKNINLPGGNIPLSVSAWFRGDSLTTTNNDTIVCLGTNSTATGGGSFILRVNSDKVRINFEQSSNYTQFNKTVSSDVWYHAVATYDGGTSASGRKLFIDGVEIAQTSTSGTITGVNLPVNPDFAVGMRTDISGYLDGAIANFKLWDVALTADEVKRLYDMGRCDEGHHVVNFSKTRVGIGLGDGEAPTYTLDVRGQIRSQGSLVTSFTGQHKCVPENGEPVEKGLIVSASKNKFVKLNGGLDTGKKAITIDESLPVVSLSNVAQDKACFGVVSSTEEANTVYRIETTNGGVISHIPKTLGDNRVIVNSVGEGAIWVCDANGPLESGDYITTSNVAGYGQKQTGEFLANYTVAKITMDCDFTGSNVAVQAIKKVETLKTVTEDVWQGLSDYDRSSNTETQYINESNVVLSIEEYESLAPEEQNTYSETTIQTYYRIQRGENVLDEHGMLQWENTGATEPGYELRYLDATGQQTDEANCVHRAAFVGCTYHCG
jgi:hypothetical protein